MILELLLLAALVLNVYVMLSRRNIMVFDDGNYVATLKGVIWHEPGDFFKVLSGVNLDRQVPGLSAIYRPMVSWARIREGLACELALWDDSSLTFILTAQFPFITKVERDELVIGN